MTDPAQIPAVLYGAKSTQDRNESIRTQMDDARCMAEREGWNVVGEFHDEGFSAYSGNRGPGLDRAKHVAIEAARKSGQCMLVVQHSDRLARGDGIDADHLAELFFSLRRQAVRMRSVQDDSNLEDAIRAVLIGERNTEDSRRKSEATRAGKLRRAQRGDSTGALQFGYRLEPRPDGEGKLRVPEPSEAVIVQRMFAMLDEGRGVGEITRWVNGQGVRTKRGNTFGRSRVREILRNPWYGGKVRSHDQVFDGNHDPLLSWDEFQRISAKLDRVGDPVAARKRQGGRPSDVALLSGVMFCAHCGHGIWHRKKDPRRYSCGNVRHATGVCDAAPFDAALAEQAVLDHLSQLFLDFDGWLQGVTDHHDSQRQGLVNEIAEVQRLREALGKDEILVRDSYRSELRRGNDRAAELATGELDRIAEERAQLDAKAQTIEAALASWDARDAADEMLDWWTEFSVGVRGHVVEARSVREANVALKERFAAIFVNSRPGGVPRLDFVLRDRAPGAPLVSSRLWADAEQPDDGALVQFIQEDLPRPGEQRDPLKVSGSPSCGSIP